jgi:hypothetical protein
MTHRRGPSTGRGPVGLPPPHGLLWGSKVRKVTFFCGTQRAQTWQARSDVVIREAAEV